jgi:hypothetical protein
MKSERKRCEVIYSTLGNLVEALYDSVPKDISNARHRNLLVAIALLDIQSKIRNKVTKNAIVA